MNDIAILVALPFRLLLATGKEVLLRAVGAIVDQGRRFVLCQVVETRFHHQPLAGGDLTGDSLRLLVDRPADRQIGLRDLVVVIAADRAPAC